MLIQYCRTKLFSTTFYDGHGKPIYRTETVNRAWMPLTTQIIRINSVPDIEKDEIDEKSTEHRDGWESESVLATISWSWPSAKKSTVTFEGKTMSLQEFLEPGRGCMKYVVRLTNHLQ